ncbi:hypothetical protein Poli38472_006235 [Pythium oligandrum]|uniref:Apple domain-containing protein n=1 Tax=Pythium oligandrum TaxID=41045 RepID=A0A8K1CRZ4_PYTOL|nr:hypothetical protein Poli38472_006235 [Pythium oligandrum]|eukprot:TMW68767.1 hypothetical protein Poli38472_006235 [Pythium oligandrum]
MLTVGATLLVGFTSTSVCAQAPEATCTTSPYEGCGSDAGTTCCPADFYCQPWNSAYYQCMPAPSQCPRQATNIDFFGDDLETVYGIQPTECCDKCTKTPHCVAYTFVNSNPGQPACYLKKGLGQERKSVGAVSGVVRTTTPTPTPSVTPTMTPSSLTTPSCATAEYGNCGSSEDIKCCPSGYYCQPWSQWYYQCMPAPAQCKTPLTGVAYYGNNLKTVAVSQPSQCCDACVKTKGCKAFTFINSSPNGPVCYLKSSASSPKKRAGAISSCVQ